MKNKSIIYKCPRCHGKNIIDYGEIIECMKCRLEFYKEHVKTLTNSNILAISELSDIVGALFELND